MFKSSTMSAETPQMPMDVPIPLVTETLSPSTEKRDHFVCCGPALYHSPVVEFQTTIGRFRLSATCIVGIRLRVNELLGLLVLKLDLPGYLLHVSLEAYCVSTRSVGRKFRRAVADTT